MYPITPQNINVWTSCITKNLWELSEPDKRQGMIFQGWHIHILPQKFANIRQMKKTSWGPWFLEIQILQYYTCYMYYHGSLFFGKTNLAISHILHILPGVLGFYKLKYCNITHITCITMGLSFFGSHIWQYYTYYQGSLVFGNSEFAILHILHVLPWVPLFWKVKFGNITHITPITRGPCFFINSILQYYT